MECLPQLYEQLTKLVNNIRQCNYTSYNERQDIIHDTLEKIVIKHQEGVLADDFNEIKGYSFMVLRNFCNAYHKKLKPTYTDEELENNDEFIDIFAEEQNRLYLHSIIEKSLKNKKYSDLERKVCKMILDNSENKEIIKETNLSSKELAALRLALKNKLKFDAHKPVRYIIKHAVDKEFSIKCHTRADVLEYFSDYHKVHVYYLIQSGNRTHKGFYIKSLTKHKGWKKVKEN
jgi:hypothetical protein